MDLLLAHSDDGRPVLEERPDPGSAAGQARPVPRRAVDRLADITANVDALARQRWAVVVPEGAAGQRLADLVRDLAARRAEEQEDDVLIVRVPPGQTADAAMQWKKDEYPALYGAHERLRPRYLLILGDLDQVSLATQQALAVDGMPGRLACDDDDGYQAYVHKVLAWERAASAHERPRMLFYTVHDGTSATDSGHAKLMQPCAARCQREWAEHRRGFPASSVEVHGNEHAPTPTELLALVAQQQPSVLFSLSHGMGPPRRRQWTPSQAREQQGAMCFGSEGALMPSDLASAPFLPGGLWLYFACFGAGTPDQSAYHHWLAMLAQHGMQGLGPLHAVLAGLSRPGSFTSGVARAALANPRGPLAMLGHIDLAWSYAYEELRVAGGRSITGTSRATSFYNLLGTLVQGKRVGAAFLQLQADLDAIGRELATRYDQCKAQGVEPEGASADERLALGHLWMRRQDLLGYVLLGDPAVRLPLAARQPRAGLGRTTSRPRIGQGAAQPDADDSADVTDLGDIGSERLARIEEAILAQASGERSVGQVARELGIRQSQARHWEEVYREAGRRALASLFACEGLAPEPDEDA